MTHVLGAVQDITQRKQAEQDLRDIEERYRLATQATSDVIWDWDRRTGQVRWGESLPSVFGYQAAEGGSHIDQALSWWCERIHPYDRERVLAALEQAIAGRTASFAQEYRFRRADGSYAEVLDRAHIVRNEQGHAVRLVGAMMDVTERKQAERELRAHAELLEILSRRLVTARKSSEATWPASCTTRSAKCSPRST
jgi:PAS domain S-box-containing protein